jgi:antitoxin (DNA-binding transcriptional repressor) of toxin-antitoxin stability system
MSEQRVAADGGTDHLERAARDTARTAKRTSPGRRPRRLRILTIEIAITYSYNRKMKVSVAEAKNTLPKLIKAVEDGESVTIYRHGTPVVDIVRTTKAHPEKPKFGTLKDKVTALDPDWWKPMTNGEVEALLDGH